MDHTAETETALRGVDVAGSPDNPAIVFVHGATLTRKEWVPQREALADEFHVIAFDLPGHGTRRETEFDLDAAAQLLDHSIEEIAGGEAIVVGLSLGGYVATAYVQERPENVSALVISGSSVNPVGVVGWLTRLVAAISTRATEHERINRAIRWLAKAYVSQLDIDADERAEIIAEGFFPKPFGKAGYELAGENFRGALATYTGPVLVLNGRWDLCMRLGQQDHAAAAPNGRVEVIDQAGHICNLDRAQAYTEALTHFVPDIE